MKDFWLKKRLSLLLTVLLLVVAIGGTVFTYQAWVNSKPAQVTSVEDNKPLTNQELYAAAVDDAITIEPEEVLPVVAITPESDLVTWNETKDKVLLLSWHKYPDSYKPQTEISLDWGEVWTFTDKEIKAWYDKNQAGVTDWDLRLKQLIGLPEDSAYTHFTAIWVSPEDIERPAYEKDITKTAMATAFPEDEADEAFVDWFNGNIVWSYFDSAYPWTRLGYTYDWAGKGTEYGLSEFLVKKGAKVQVEFTYTTQEFLQWLNEKAKAA